MSDRDEPPMNPLEASLQRITSLLLPQRWSGLARRVPTGRLMSGGFPFGRASCSPARSFTRSNWAATNICQYQINFCRCGSSLVMLQSLLTRHRHAAQRETGHGSVTVWEPGDAQLPDFRTVRGVRGRDEHCGPGKHLSGVRRSGSVERSPGSTW